MKKLKTFINEEVNKIGVSGNSYKITMEEDLDNNIAKIKQDGKIIAIYEFGGAGVLKIKVNNQPEVLNSLVDLIYKYGR